MHGLKQHIRVERSFCRDGRGRPQGASDDEKGRAKTVSPRSSSRAERAGDSRGGPSSRARRRPRAQAGRETLCVCRMPQAAWDGQNRLSAGRILHSDSDARVCARVPRRLRRTPPATYVPASTVSVTVKPSLHTFRCVSVTMASMPWRVNSSLQRRVSKWAIEIYGAGRVCVMSALVGGGRSRRCAPLVRTHIAPRVHTNKRTKL